MNQSKAPLWRKSILDKLSLSDIREWLCEVGENGDPYGYERGDEGYYNEYKELFDDLSAGAYTMLEALEDNQQIVEENWDDVTVGLLGLEYEVLGYDSSEYDYFRMLTWDQDYAIEEAKKRLKRLTKDELISTFGKVLRTLLLFFDLKASHDCLTAVVAELDERGALLEAKNERINQLYADLMGKGSAAFDAEIKNLPGRMWIE